MKITEDDIKSVMAQTWGIKKDEIPNDAALNQFVQWDSLGHVNLLLAFEEKFGLEINNETVTGLTSLEIIFKYFLPPPTKH